MTLYSFLALQTPLIRNNRGIVCAMSKTPGWSLIHTSRSCWPAVALPGVCEFVSAEAMGVEDLHRALKSCATMPLQN